MGEQLEQIEVAGFPGVASRGGGRTIVFLHGAWDSHVCFERFVGWFGGRGWDAYALSRRGRLGVGPDRCVGVTMEDYLSDTRAVLDAIDRDAVVVGHSMGGLIAQVMAAEGRCRAAVLLEPGPPREVPVVPQARTWPMFARLAPRVMTGRPFMPTRRDARRAFLNGLDDREVGGVYDRFVPESGRAFRQILLGYRMDVAAVTCPVLCVTGLACPSITPKMVRKVARLYDADLLELEGHSHWMMEEPGWDSIAASIDRWLDDGQDPSATPGQVASREASR